MMTKEYEKKIRELQLALKTKGILRTKDEVFNMMVELLKRELRSK